MDYLATKARDDKLVILSLIVVPKGRSRRKRKSLVGSKWEGRRWADKGEILFQSFMRGGTSSQELNFWSFHEEEDTQFDHFKLEEIMKKGSNSSKFKV